MKTLTIPQVEEVLIHVRHALAVAVLAEADPDNRDPILKDAVGAIANELNAARLTLEKLMK